MAKPKDIIGVYLEIGKKRTVAGALEWPGLCRNGRDEQGALQALLECGPRYAPVAQAAGLTFTVPTNVSAFNVVERLDGDGTTDFGAPSLTPSSDTRPIEDAELKRLKALLQACWQALDAAVEAASGKELRKGPRGGGRELDKIVEHVLDAERSYLARLAWKHEKRQAANQREELAHARREVLDALTAAAHGELPTRGPRGGVLWVPRYFVRRTAWHVLDHVWEIEDRVL